MTSPDTATVFRVVDVMRVEAFGRTFVAVSPALPQLDPDRTYRVRIRCTSGETVQASAVPEYRKTPPREAVLLGFTDLLKADVPMDSELQFLD